jgi:hypothetical protein
VRKVIATSHLHYLTTGSNPGSRYSAVCILVSHQPLAEEEMKWLLPGGCWLDWSWLIGKIEHAKNHI